MLLEAPDHVNTPFAVKMHTEPESRGGEWVGLSNFTRLPFAIAVEQCTTFLSPAPLYKEVEDVSIHPVGPGDGAICP